MTAVITGHWPAFAIAAGALLLLISATGFARASHPRWHRAHRPPSRHAADSDEDWQTIAWLARIRPRPLADARIRVAALTAVLDQAASSTGPMVLPARADGLPHADADQFLAPWEEAAVPLTPEPELEPLPDEPFPSFLHACPDVPTGIIEFDGELSAEQVEEFREAFGVASREPVGLIRQYGIELPPADPAMAGHLQPLWADDTGSFAAICAGDAV